MAIKHVVEALVDIENSPSATDEEGNYYYLHVEPDELDESVIIVRLVWESLSTESDEEYEIKIARVV